MTARLLPWLAAVLGACAVAAALAAWLLGPPAGGAAAAAARTAPTERFELPPVRTAEPEADLADVVAARLLAGTLPVLPLQPAGELPSLTPADWRISGTFVAGGTPTLLLTRPGEPDRQLKVGDTLPGGARILAISPESLCIALNGKRLTLSVLPS